MSHILLVKAARTERQAHGQTHQQQQDVAGKGAMVHSSGHSEVCTWRIGELCAAATHFCNKRLHMQRAQARMCGWVPKRAACVKCRFMNARTAKQWQSPKQLQGGVPSFIQLYQQRRKHDESAGARKQRGSLARRHHGG
jgi:hypothetical protein